MLTYKPSHSGIEMRAILHKVLVTFICNMCSEITFSNYSHIFQGQMS